MSYSRPAWQAVRKQAVQVRNPWYLSVFCSTDLFHLFACSHSRCTSEVLYSRPAWQAVCTRARRKQAVQVCNPWCLSLFCITGLSRLLGTAAVTAAKEVKQAGDARYRQTPGGMYMHCTSEVLHGRPAWQAVCKRARQSKIRQEHLCINIGTLTSVMC